MLTACVDKSDDTVELVRFGDEGRLTLHSDSAHVHRIDLLEEGWSLGLYNASPLPQLSLTNGRAAPQRFELTLTNVDPRALVRVVISGISPEANQDVACIATPNTGRVPLESPLQPAFSSAGARVAFEVPGCTQAHLRFFPSPLPADWTLWVVAKPDQAARVRRALLEGDADVDHVIFLSGGARPQGADPYQFLLTAMAGVSVGWTLIPGLREARAGTGRLDRRLGRLNHELRVGDASLLLLAPSERRYLSSLLPLLGSLEPALHRPRMVFVAVPPVSPTAPDERAARQLSDGLAVLRYLEQLDTSVLVTLSRSTETRDSYLGLRWVALSDDPSASADGLRVRITAPWDLTPPCGDLPPCEGGDCERCWLPCQRDVDCPSDHGCDAELLRCRPRCAESTCPEGLVCGMDALCVHLPSITLEALVLP